jgi:hypothetical protein
VQSSSNSSDLIEPSLLHADRLRDYFRTLGPSVKSALLAELEREPMAGEGLSATNLILSSLRLDLRERQSESPRIANASRVFFKPIQPLLVDAVSGDNKPRKILRASLGPIWAWICRDLLPGTAQAYSEAAKDAIVIGDQGRLLQLAQDFRQRVFAQATKELSTLTGKQRTNDRLAAFGAPECALDDIGHILTIFQSQGFSSI